MTRDWLYELDLSLILAGTLLLLLLSLAFGYWVGLIAGRKIKKDHLINTIQAATLGLLGLLLAFTFSMADSRYETRRELVIQESDAIEMTYLRAQMLPEPYHSRISDLLREYVDVRLEFFNAGIDPERIQQSITKSVEIHTQLWKDAVELSKADPRSIPYGLFFQSLNEVIDLHSNRLAAMNNHVPEVIIDMIFISSFITFVMLGYNLGMFQQKNILPTLMTLFLVVVIIGTIIDLDRPRRGLIQVSQASMIQLQQSIK